MKAAYPCMSLVGDDCSVKTVWRLCAAWYVISVFPHKRQCQQADTLFTETHNEGQSEAVILWSLRRGATVCPGHVTHTHTHTHTSAHSHTHTHIHTTFNTQIRTHQNTCKYESTHTWNYAHACRHKQSQLSTAVAWFYVRMAIEAEEVVSQHHSWVQPLISLSLSFCLGLIHSLSLSRPFPELLLVTPSASQTFSVMVLPFGQKNVMNPHHFFFKGITINKVKQLI